MATLVANQALNMNSALGVLDSEVTLTQLVSASSDGTHQVWAVPGGYLEIDANASVSDTAFSATLGRLELQTGPALGDPAKWTLTNIPLSISGSFSFDEYSMVLTMDVMVPGLWQAHVSMDFDSGEILNISDSFTGSYDSFVDFIFRQADRITGSSQGDTLLGFGGNDTINGGGGADKLDGGADSDRLLGGAGNDVLTWGTGDAKLDGGAGTDTMKLSVNLDLTSLANSKFANIEQINMTGGGGDVLTLDVTDVLQFSSSTDTLKILGDTTDTVHMGAGWTTGADQVIGGVTYHTYTQGSATLLVDQDITSVI